MHNQWCCIKNKNTRCQQNKTSGAPIHQISQTTHVSSSECDLSVSISVINFAVVFFSALTLLVERQEGHPACKKTEWWDVGVVVWDEMQTCM